MPAGRPEFEITDEVLRKVEGLAAQGLTQGQIATCIGMAVSTLCDKKNKYIEFSEAIKRGQEKGIAQVTNALFKKANDGDNIAMIFYLKNRDPDQWKDRKEHTHSGDPKNPIKTEVITTTMTEKEAMLAYARMIKDDQDKP